MDNHVIYVMDYHQDILDYIIKSSIKMLWIISINQILIFILIENLEAVSLILQPLQRTWQGGLQLLDALQRVVERDD